MNQSYIFILNDQEIKAQMTYQFMRNVGQKIADELFKNSGKYYVQSKVSNESFNTILDCLNEKTKDPVLNVNNFYDFVQLSDEFNNVLSNYLSEQKFEQIRNISHLQIAIKKDDINKSYCEEYIAEHLDYYLKNHKKEMADISYISLYNIFNHKKRVLNDQEEAYQFIIQNAENNSNGIEIKQSFYTLLQSLDGDKINEESLKESLSKKDEHFGFAPKTNLSFITSFNNCVSQLETKFDRSFKDIMNLQNQMMNNMKSLFENKINSINDNCESLSRQSNETKDAIKSLTDSIKNIEKEVKQMSLKNEEIQKQIQNISSNNDENQNNIKNILNNVENNNKEVKQVSTKNEEIQKKIIVVSETVKSIEIEAEKISKTNDETKNNVKTLNESIRSIENDVKSMSKTKQDTESNIQNIYSKNEETHKKIDDLSAKIDDIKSKNAQIAIKCDDTIKIIQQFPSKFNDIESNMKKIFDKACDTLSVSYANIGSFRGIIRQLTEACGGNVCDKGIVNVTSSSRQISDYYNPKNIVDLDNTENCFGSSNIGNSWLKYDFKYKKIRPICYLIRSTKEGKGSYHPMNWVIEGSNSDLSNDWTILDTRNNITSLDDSNAVQIFSIQKTDLFYRYLRIRQTGKNSYNNDYFEISALEYFGSIQ